MKRIPFVLALGAALALTALPWSLDAAPPFKVKLATLVPDGSIWHKAMLEMGDGWTKGTAGRVSLLIYPGGASGDEPDMVRKMRIGQIHASALTVKGLAEIDDAFAVFTVPGMFESYDELNFVLDRMEPMLRKRLEAKGFVLLNWGHAGWVYFFSKEPVKSMADLKKLKMWWWAGDEKMLTLWKEHGFRPVALQATDILSGLQTGMIDAMPNVPLAAVMWFRTTPNMLDVGLTPLVGGLVMSKKSWDKVSEADRAVMAESCKKLEARLERAIPQQDRDALEQMKQRGLNVTKLDAAGAAAWKAETEAFAAKMKGGLVPPDVMELALRERAAFRQQKP